jgi:hypothetical protein
LIRGGYRFSEKIIFRAPAKKTERGSRHPGLPLFEAHWARRFDWMPADLI